MSDGNQRISTISFKLRFGELNLGTLSRQMVLGPAAPFGGLVDQASLDEMLEDIPGEAQGLLVRSLPVGSWLPKLSFHRSWIRYVPRQYDRHYADLSTTYDEYMSCFSAKSRSSLRRKVRKIEEHGGGAAKWRCYKTPGEIEEFYRFARDLSRQSYQERLLDAGLPEGEAFQAAMVEAANEGRVRGYLLFLDDAPLAYLYCPIQDGIVSYAYLGYRAEFSELSPGTVLLWLVMEDLFREGTHRIFDFTEGGDRGRHSQKRLFSTNSVQCADVYLLRRSLANLTIVLTHANVDLLSASIGLGLERIGLKRAVRSWVRLLRK